MSLMYDPTCTLLNGLFSFSIFPRCELSAFLIFTFVSDVILLLSCNAENKFQGLYVVCQIVAVWCYLPCMGYVSQGWRRILVQNSTRLLFCWNLLMHFFAGKNSFRFFFLCLCENFNFDVLDSMLTVYQYIRAPICFRNSATLRTSITRDGLRRGCAVPHSLTWYAQWPTTV